MRRRLELRASEGYPRTLALEFRGRFVRIILQAGNGQMLAYTAEYLEEHRVDMRPGNACLWVKDVAAFDLSDDEAERVEAFLAECRETQKREAK